MEGEVLGRNEICPRFGPYANGSLETRPRRRRRFSSPCLLTLPDSRRRRSRASRRFTSIGKAWHWLLLALLIVSGVSPCARVAASATKTYYSVLEVQSSSSEEELKRAYRRAAVKWHPDKNTGKVELAEKKFKEIQQAYDVLKDPRSRAEYDDSLSLRRSRRSSNGEPAAAYARRSGEASDSEDAFSAGFYARMRGRTPLGDWGGRGYWGGSPGYDQRFDGVRVNLFDVFRFGAGKRENMGVPKARWRHLHVRLSVSLQELLTGVVKEIDIRDSIVERYKQAVRTGLLSEVVQEGAVVLGALLLRCPLPISAVAFATYVHLKLPRVPRGTFRVPILPGYRRGTKITFSTPEDVNVTFEVVEKESEFRRYGDDLSVVVRISSKMAKRGGSVRVPTLDQGKVSMKLVRGEVSDGYERRLPGLGMPRRSGGVEDSSSLRGDLIVHFVVEDAP